MVNREPDQDEKERFLAVGQKRVKIEGTLMSFDFVGRGVAA